MNEYVIINKTAIQKRIEELKKQRELASFNEYNQISAEIKIYEQLLSDSTPFIRSSF